MFLRRGIPCIALAILAASFTPSTPASAAPAQVGMVSFIGASGTSLTLSWPKASGADSYEIFRSLHEDMTSATNVKATTATVATVTGLTKGETYCFQVRARSGSTVAMRSAHTCKPTIRGEASIGGTLFGVLTFNACSEACAGWSTRLAAVKTLISTRDPDVIAAQEAGAWTTPPSGYANAYYKSAKRLFYKTSRFTIATRSGVPRAGFVEMSTGKYAVWAELIERSTSKRIIFVSAHTSSALADYAIRGQQVAKLLQDIGRINTYGRQVVFAGDYNSHKNRGTYSESAGFGVQDTVGRTFAAAGYYDSYDLARTLQRPNWNSASGLTATPTISRTWGDHVDHVFVQPARANVWRWMNAAIHSATTYATPKPSDHNGVLVNLYLR